MPDNDWYEYLRKLLTVNQPPPNPSGQYRLPDIGLRMGRPGESAMTSNPRPNYRRSELESMDRLKDYGQPQPDPDAPIIRPGMSAMERMPPVSTVTSTTPPPEPDRIRPMPTGPMKPQAQRPTTVGRVGPSNQAQTQPQTPQSPNMYYMDPGDGGPMRSLGRSLPNGMSVGQQQGGGYISAVPIPQPTTGMQKFFQADYSGQNPVARPQANVPMPPPRPANLGQPTPQPQTRTEAPANKDYGDRTPPLARQQASAPVEGKGWRDLALAKNQEFSDLGLSGDKAGGRINHAHKIAKEKATPCHSGIINMAVGGRTDHIPMNVLEGSYVLPADIVSGLGEGNTLAGSKILDNMFQSAPYGAKIPNARANPKFPSAAPMGGSTTSTPARAAGGRSMSPTSKPIPIVAAGGEYVVHPGTVTQLGKGDMNAGHEYLDNFVKYVRAHTAKTLQNLPGPRKD